MENKTKLSAKDWHSLHRFWLQMENWAFWEYAWDRVLAKNSFYRSCKENREHCFEMEMKRTGLEVIE